MNAAGLRSDEVDRMLGRDSFTVTPRRGELIVFDKLSRPLVRHIVLAVPTQVSKGVLVAPTVFGNVMVGPTAEDIERKDDTSLHGGRPGLPAREAARIVPALAGHEVTAVYVGLRAATEHADFQIRFEDGYACVGGIRSTGLSAALAIAEHVREGLDVEPAPRAGLPSVRMPNVGEAFPRPYQRADLIADDPDYGRVVCFCERVTRGEIRDAFASPVPPVDLDGLRRRTRAHMGRCQGFYCGARLAAASPSARRRMPDAPSRRRRWPGRPGGGDRAAPPRRGRGGGDRARARGRWHPPPRPPPGLRAARPAPPAERTGLRAPLRASSRAPPARSC